MIVDLAVYENGKRRPGELKLDDAGEAAAKDNAFVWLGVVEPDNEEFNRITKEFELPQLAVDDAVNAHQRPKAEVYGDTLFVVVKTAQYIDETELVEIGEIMLFLSNNFVISVRHGGHRLDEVRQAVEARPDLQETGPGAVLYELLDRTVDDYQVAVQGISVDVDEIERQVFSGERTSPTQRIYTLEREVLALNAAVAPLAAALESISRDADHIVVDPLDDYFRDVSDHLQRVTGRIDTLRELLSSVLQANLTQVSVQQNNDMRAISAWVAIAAVPTMLAGIYGMNFEHMPELGWRYGYPFALGVMLTICLGLYIRFKRIHWL